MTVQLRVSTTRARASDSTDATRSWSPRERCLAMSTLWRRPASKPTILGHTMAASHAYDAPATTALARRLHAEAGVGTSPLRGRRCQGTVTDIGLRAPLGQGSRPTPPGPPARHPRPQPRTRDCQTRTTSRGSSRRRPSMSCRRRRGSASPLRCCGALTGGSCADPRFGRSWDQLRFFTACETGFGSASGPNMTMTLRTLRSPAKASVRQLFLFRLEYQVQGGPGDGGRRATA